MPDTNSEKPASICVGGWRVGGGGIIGPDDVSMTMGLYVSTE